MVTLGFGLYLVAHFALYALWLRHVAFVSTEKGIFLYHFVPAASWVLVLGTLWLTGPAVSLAEVILVAGLHGIYSLTFLELWALADGGYSLAILERLESRGEADEPSILAELEGLGGEKRAARLADLLRMGLVEEHDGRYGLTPPGRVAAAFIAVIARLSAAPMGR